MKVFKQIFFKRKNNIIFMNEKLNKSLQSYCVCRKRRNLTRIYPISTSTRENGILKVKCLIFDI